MGGAKVLKIVLDGNGSYLGMEKGCFVVKDKEDNVQRFPLFENEIGEVVLKSSNAVSTGALACLGFWGVDVLILTQRGRPVAMLKSLDDDSHVETRVSQYEALKNGMGVKVAKWLVSARVESQNLVLRKHGLRQLDLLTIKHRIESIEADSLRVARKRLLPIEGHASNIYFKQVFQLLPKGIRIENRRTFKAYDGINNTFNLAYAVLKWKVHRALLKAKLEPYLGFLHSEQFGKPSLVCDFMELYRCLVDDFLIQYSQKLRKKDFKVKREDYSSSRKGKREYLRKEKTRDFMERLYGLFESYVDVARVKHGNRQTVETLINEEALLLAEYLRIERNAWSPRIAVL